MRSLRMVSPPYPSPASLCCDVSEKNLSSQVELKRVSQKLKDKQTELGNDRESEKELDSAIRNDKTGQEIQRLEGEIKRKEKEQEKCEEKLKKYNKAAAEINLAENPDESLFIEQTQTAKDKAKEINTELNDKETG